MNRSILIHRLTGPAILLLLGTVALLHEARIVSWDIFIPLLLILIGAIKLAQRAAMANEPYPPAPPYPGAGYPNTGPNAGPYNQYGAPYPAQQAIVPASHDFGAHPDIDPDHDPNGGKR